MSDIRQRIAESFEQHAGSVTKVAEELGLARGTVYYHLDRLGLRGQRPLASGQVAGMETESRRLPARGKVRRYLLTSAQNNTHLHEQFWANLLAYAQHLDAELHVSTFTYNKTSYGKLSVKRGTASHDADLWYDTRIEPYVSDTRIELAPGLLWCGEMNILPTARRPLTGFETYTGRKSGIFPHAKFAMESVASGKHEATKFNYTTGTVTQRNYIQKRAGLAAEHHHSYGALVVEVDSQGRWFVRQINALESDGSFQDLDVVVRDGEVVEGQSVEAITWGDFHLEQADSDVMSVAFQDGGMLDTLRPDVQFVHDILDFSARNHHDARNPHVRFARHVNGEDTVEESISRCVNQVVDWVLREWCETVVVNSNHDNFYERWLREADYRHDPPNAVFFLESQLEKYKSIARFDDGWMLIEWAMRRLGMPEEVIFLRQDQSFTVCGGEIECGWHGDLGPNGSKGSPLGLSKIGRKANTGHTHAAGIIDGMYTAGTCSRLDLGYNVGPSSWSHSHIVTYRNGKRAIVTMWDGRWRA